MQGGRLDILRGQMYNLFDIGCERKSGAAMPSKESRRPWLKAAAEGTAPETPVSRQADKA